MEWHCVYDLACDYSSVEQIQKATLETDDGGLLPEIALFGTIEWWDAVNDGRIPKFELEGVISKVNEIVRGDWPICEIDTNGEKTEWTRYGDDAPYKVGRRIRIEYVYQKRRSLRFRKTLGDKFEVVLKVLIEF